MVHIYREAKRRGIYQPLFTDPEGDSCFSIYQFANQNARKLLSTDLVNTKPGCLGCPTQNPRRDFKWEEFRRKRAFVFYARLEI